MCRLLVGRRRVHVDVWDATQGHTSLMRTHPGVHPKVQAYLGYISNQRLAGYTSTASLGL